MRIFLLTGESSFKNDQMSRLLKQDPQVVKSMENLSIAQLIWIYLDLFHISVKCYIAL